VHSLGKSLFCTGFEVSSYRDAFLLIFRFASPDGYTESVYITITPEGAAVLHEKLGEEIREYIEKHGNIPMGGWFTEQKEKTGGNQNTNTYLT